MDVLSIIPAKSNQKMSGAYDSDVLREFAEKLHSRASSIAFEYVAGCGLLAFVIGCSLGIFAGRQAFQDIPNFDVNSTALVIGAIFAVIGIIIGVVKGREKSFHLKLEAQKILLQMQIEENTRKTALTSTVEVARSSS